jgi:hypothetical protein
MFCRTLVRSSAILARISGEICPAASPVGVCGGGACGLAASAPAARSTAGRLDGCALCPFFAAAVVDAPLSATNASTVSTTRRHARGDFRCLELAGAAGKPRERAL